MTGKANFKKFLPAFFLLISAVSMAFAAADEECLFCHGDKRLKSAQGRSMFVDQKKFKASVHGLMGIGCTDCHTNLQGVKDFPHDDTFRPAQCTACHPGAGRRFQWGKLRKVSKKPEKPDKGLQRGLIHELTKTAENKSVVFIKILYRVVIAGLISLFLVFIAADLFHRIIIRWKR